MARPYIHSTSSTSNLREIIDGLWPLRFDATNIKGCVYVLILVMFPPRLPKLLQHGELIVQDAQIRHVGVPGLRSSQKFRQIFRARPSKCRNTPHLSKVGPSCLSFSWPLPWPCFPLSKLTLSLFSCSYQYSEQILTPAAKSSIFFRCIGERDFAVLRTHHQQRHSASDRDE